MQLSLLGRETPEFDPCVPGRRRIDLGAGAWVDHAPGWVRGHGALFDALAHGMEWHGGRRLMYDRYVDVPRVTASVPADGEGHPVLPAIAAALSRIYGASFSWISMALYRSGKDSVAWHGDKVLKDLPEALVATVSVGAPRPFQLRPVGGGESVVLRAGWGDLIVMGGTCQNTWEHGVPKVRHADPRLAIMFREERRVYGG